MTRTTLRETFKAYLRGCIISHQSSAKKHSRAEQLVLEEEIKQLDTDNAHSPTIEKHNKISALKYKLNNLLSDRISRAFLDTKQKFFGFGDKPHKLLAPIESLST